MNDRDDLVRDFFASHRDQVSDQPADDQTWETITTRAREARNRSRGMWFLGGAVAASAAAVAVLTFQGLGGPGAQQLAPAGTTQTSTTDAGPEDGAVTAGPTGDAPEGAEDASGTEGPASDVTGTEETPVAPPTFLLPVPDLTGTVVQAVGEPTGDLDSTLRTAVYETGCAAAENEWSCPGLAVSEDGGRTWTPRVDMVRAGYYGAVAAGDRMWMWAAGGDRPGVPEVQTGLVRSDDGGRTWSEVATRGDGTLWVQAFRNTLVVVTQGCEADPSPTCVEMVVTDVADDDATEGRRLITIDDLAPSWWSVPGPLPEGGLKATYDAIYLVVPGGDTAYRVADGEQVATRVERPGCVIAAAPESQDSLVSWCHASDVVAVSADGGTTWQDVQGVGGAAVVGLASNDGTHLVMATDDGLHIGADGDWSRVLEWPGGRTRLDALGAQTMHFGSWYRTLGSGQEAAQRWSSTDDGRTWTVEPPILIGADADDA